MVNESSAIQVIFDDDLDLGMMQALIQQRDSNSANEKSDLEALMRDHWGLPAVDVSDQISRFQRGSSQVKPSDDDEDDFTAEEWRLILAMRKICLSIIDSSTTEPAMERNLEWMFVRGTEEPRTGVSFHLACQMLQARPWVLQALVQHIWFARNIVPPALPFLGDPMPEALQSEAILHAWGEGAEILAGVWMRPGIYSFDLQRKVLDIPEAQFETALSSLIACGLVGNRLGRLYCISRPVEFRRSGQPVSWSSSFIGD